MVVVLTTDSDGSDRGSRRERIQPDVPRRSHHAHNRRDHRTHDGDRQHPVAHRGRLLAQQDPGAERHEDDEGDLDGAVEQEIHRDPSFLAFATSSAIRSSSASERRAPSPPSSAPTTFSVEPSKKVSTRCRSADFRAACRGTAGM